MNYEALLQCRFSIFASKLNRSSHKHIYSAFSNIFFIIVLHKLCVNMHYSGFSKKMEPMGCTGIHKIYLKFFFNIYLFLRQRETEHEWGEGQREGDTEFGSRLQAPSCQHRARRGARTCEPQDHDLSRSRTLNRLSHPSTPNRSFLRSGT